MQSSNTQSSDWIKRLGISAMCLLSALSLGATYGWSDQTVYMLPGLRLANPSLWKNDWLVSHTAHPHIAFNYLIYVLSMIGPVEWTTTALHLGTMTAMSISVYLILAALYERPFLPFLFSIVLLQLVIGKVVLSHGFFLPLLLPTNLAASFFLSGIAVLVRAVRHRRIQDAQRNCPKTIRHRAHIQCLYLFFLSGLLFGLAAIVHGTFLCLIPVFLLGVLICRRMPVSQVVALGAPYVVVILPALWWALWNFVLTRPGSLERLDEIARLRIPHHYLPSTWGTEPFLMFTGSILLGAIGLILRRPEKKEASVVFASVASIAGISVVVFLSTVVFFVPQVAMLQAYRFVSFLSVFSVLFFSGAIAGQIELASGSRSSSKTGVKFLLVIFGLTVVFWIDALVGITFAVLYVFGMVGMKLESHRPHSAKMGTFSLVFGVSIFFVWYAAERFPYSTHALVPVTKSRAALFNWVRESTPKNAVFVVPIDFQKFRLHTRRSIVVDWKGNAFRLEDVEEWCRRIRAVCGDPKANSYRELYRGYQTLGVKRARQLADEFGAQYVVVKAYQHRGHLGEFERVYSQGGFLVYRICRSVAISREFAS